MGGVGKGKIERSLSLYTSVLLQVLIQESISVESSGRLYKSSW